MNTHIIITNNPLIKKHYKNETMVEEETYLNVLETARDYIHQGHRLLTHPLAGSVKPNQNPYRTVLVSKDVKKLDFNSLSLIENAIKVAKKMLDEKDIPKWSQSIKEDFQFVDKSLIDNAIRE